MFPKNASFYSGNPTSLSQAAEIKHAMNMVQTAVACSRCEKLMTQGWNGGKGVAEQPLKKTICKFWLEARCENR